MVRGLGNWLEVVFRMGRDGNPKSSRLSRLIGQDVTIAPNNGFEVEGKLIFGTEENVGKNRRVFEVGVHVEEYHGNSSTGWYIVESGNALRFFKESIVNPSDVDTELNSIFLDNGNFEGSKKYGGILA